MLLTKTAFIQISKAAQSWLNDRAPVSSVMSMFVAMRLVGGARWQHSLGMVALYLFLQQCVIGTLLAGFYSASASDAWASTAYLQDQVAGGWLLRGLHHHGMSALVLVSALHMLSVVVRRRYTRRRELVWLSGLGLAGLLLAFSVTGYTLSFDQNAYWATQVRVGVTSSAPGGALLNQVMLGGGEFGNFTLTRTFVMHAVVLPGLVLSICVLHIFGFWWRQRAQATEAPTNSEMRPASECYWSRQWMMDVLAISIVTLILVAATVNSQGAPLGAPAEPDSTFLARPEWFLLFMFELLHHFEGPTMFIGTVIIPSGVLCFLAAIPWIGNAARGQRFVAEGVALLSCAWSTLTLMAIVKDWRNPEVHVAVIRQEQRALEARDWAKQGVLAAGGIAVFHNDPTYIAKKLYAEHCRKCHILDGEGKVEGPELSGYGTRAWIAGVVREPNSERFFGTTKHRDMDPYSESDLPAAELNAVVEYVFSLGRSDAVTASIARFYTSTFCLRRDNSPPELRRPSQSVCVLGFSSSHPALVGPSALLLMILNHFDGHVEPISNSLPTQRFGLHRGHGHADFRGRLYTLS